MFYVWVILLCIADSSFDIELFFGTPQGERKERTETAEWDALLSVLGTS